MQSQSFSIEIGGKTLTAEFTNLADQTNGSVLLRYGNTVVLATAVMGREPKDALGYFPLIVDYEEKFYAAGQILGSRFIRREGRPSEEAILSGRVVDRTVRPLFDSRLRHEVQVVITVLAIDEDDPDILAVNAASLALATSDIPWGGPVSAVRVGKYADAQGFDINPTYQERARSDYQLDMVACGKDNTINMIEVGSKEVREVIVADALLAASEQIERLQEWQKEVVAAIGKTKKELPTAEMTAEMKALFETNTAPKLDGAVFTGPAKNNINELKKEWLAAFATNFPEGNKNVADDYYETRVDALIHEEAIKKSRRADGRALNEVRPLQVEVGGISPAIHGSGTFFRGGTHVISFLTLGGPQDSLLIDTMEEQETKKRFMHHYNFPPFAPGEVGRIGGLNRRMVGHGALAEKSLEPVLPPMEKFPYTVRLVSECMASNGSTSMASVCAGSLALMDGGVPVKAAVAGISMGLMMAEDGSGNYALLTDIQGPEDHHGDMDFKVAGTSEGITGIQLDVKVNGVAISILREALGQAQEARMHILAQMNRVIAQPRADISPRAPKIVVTKIRPDQIGLVIGSGGKTVNEIREITGTEIEIEDDGTVFITGKEGAAEKAAKIIEEMTREYKPGERFDGIVTRLMDFGAFVKIGHNTEGLVHISELAPFRVERVADVVKEGETVPVIVKEIDEKGRINLSIKQADRTFAERKGVAPAAGGGDGVSGGGHGERRGGPRGGGR